MVSNSTVVESGPESLTTPHLELVNGQVPYRDAVVSWKIPKVELLGEERYIDSFESDCVTHVVLQLAFSMTMALFENETSLEILSFTRINDREFVGFENKNYPKSSNSTYINAVEVSLKRPRPNEPMEVFWRPARGIIIQRLRECKNREGYTSGL
ncbi:Dehydrocurvularin exporter [Fusarium oxysporum f. sp. albedinis]|nr:Dehydrocurvularin exporter [Fusarium oxysporum f. sp. albedinis]